MWRPRAHQPRAWARYPRALYSFTARLASRVAALATLTRTRSPSREWRVYRSSVTLYRTYVRPALSEEFTLGYPPHVL